VIIILLDDVGYAASSAFGGPVRTPTLSALSEQGLRYTRFHTTGICSPTRSSLLTGRNPHNTGIGAVMNTPDPRPGYNGFHTKDTATVATILRQNGYSTAAFGKWHQVPDWEASPVGPFDRWPTGEGFDTFYGFMGGETSQYDPVLVNGITHVMRPEGDDYHLTEDLADRAVKWMNMQQSVTPERPFMLYFSTGGAHAPLHVPRAWSDKYKGRFDSGWDEMRDEIFARQKKAGLIPRNAVLTRREDKIPSWSSLTPEQKRFAARTMEVYAGFLEHTDVQVGRLLEAVNASGEASKTLIFYVFGDNGGSAEGGLFGSVNYFADTHGKPETDEYRARHIELLGTEHSYTHYPAGWAWAMNTPYRWTKAVASHFGATRNALVVSWPGHVSGPGSLRSQFGHVNDIAPTILDAAGISLPASVDGIAQKPFDGSSMLKTITSANAPEYHPTQYFEVFGHRSIYHRGWMASAFHERLPWQMRSPTDKPFSEDNWELFDLDKDPTQATDLAGQHPSKLAEMQSLFESEAQRNNVLPLRNYSYAEAQKLPQLAGGRTSITYHDGAIGIPESSLPNTFNRSWKVTANFASTGKARGVLASVGSIDAGWSLYLDEKSCPSFAYRQYSVEPLILRCREPVGQGSHSVTMALAYEGTGRAGPAKLMLFVNGAIVDEGRVERTPPAIYTIDETFDVGIDRGSPVGNYPDGAGLGFPFTGGSIVDVNVAAK
jgi:arylsulfatase